MRTTLIALFVTMAISAFSPGMQAQAPNLNGIWEAPGNQQRRDICGEPACSALLGVEPPATRVDRNLDEPQMLPWAEQHYKSVREGIQNPNDPNAFARAELRPFWGGCTPEGPSESVRRRAFELRQFPDAVLLLFGHDHAVRRVYMDGRGHPANLKTTWMGHSIGHYEGDTLVVDTVGINDKAWIDAQGHPHTDALRLTERFRRVDPQTMEIEMTFDDPKAYAKPWRKLVIHKLRPPGPDIWDSAECEELLQMETHYSAESKK